MKSRELRERTRRFPVPGALRKIRPSEAFNTVAGCHLRDGAGATSFLLKPIALCTRAMRRAGAPMSSGRAGGQRDARAGTLWARVGPRFGSPDFRRPASRRSPPRSRSASSPAAAPAFALDGDNLRHGLNGDLGFDEEARSENISAHGPCGPAAGGGRHRGRRQPGQSVRPRSRCRRGDPCGGRAAVRRGLRRHAAGGMRTAGPQAAVRPRPPR